MTGPLIKEVHYYLDNGKVIYTEVYHKSRGYCCGKDCRHCPYDLPRTEHTIKLKEKQSED